MLPFLQTQAGAAKGHPPRRARARPHQKGGTMGQRVTKPLGFALVLALLAGAAWAQGRTTSGLTGTVRDAEGAPLPGATVEVEGANLIGGARTTSTDAEGRYRFAELPPGPYAVTVRLEGFQPVRREGVTLALGVTADV